MFPVENVPDHSGLGKINLLSYVLPRLHFCYWL